MNKLYTLLFLLLFLAVRTIAQTTTPQIIQGKTYPFVESSKQFFISDKSGALTIKLWSKKLILQKHNPDLSLQRVMQYESFPAGFRFERLLLLGGKCYILYSAASENSLNLFAAQVNVEKGELLDGGKEIVSPSNKIDLDFVHDVPFQFLLTDDSSHFAVCYKIKSPPLVTKSKNIEINGVWVFDNQLNKKWHGELALPYSEKKCKVKGRGIDNQGGFHMAVAVINDDSGFEKKQNEKIPNYSIELHSYTSATNPARVRSFNLENKFLNIMHFRGDPEKLMCFGFYDSGSSFDDDPEGLFAATLTPEASSRTILDPFPLNAINEGEKKLKQKTNEGLVKKGKPLKVDGLRITRSIPQPDGGTLLFGEQRITISSGGGYTPTGGPGGGMTYTGGVTTSTFANLFIARLTPDNKLHWMRKLDKGHSDGINQFQYLTNGNEHRFFFVKEDELQEYRLDDETGTGDMKMITEFKPLLKKTQVFYKVFSENVLLSPDKSTIVVKAQLSGDAGRFGESKPYRDDLLLQIPLDQ